MARARRGRGEGSIFPINGRWAADISIGYRADGRRRRKRVYGDSKAAVAEKLREMQGRHDRGQVLDTGPVSLAQYLAVWLEGAKASIAPNTHVDYSKNVE